MPQNNNGILSPLQLTAGYGLLNNTGIDLGTTFQSQLTEYQSTVVADLRAAVQLANAANVTVSSLTQIGNTTIPALGDSVPVAFNDTNYPKPPSPVYYLIPADPGTIMFSGQIANIGDQMLGNGSTGSFAQVFFAAQGYSTTANQFINSAVNAYSNNYLGPTYNQAASGLNNMDNLITGDVTKVTFALSAFGLDCLALGNLIDLANLEDFGSPGALLEQLATVSKINGTLPCVESALLAQGLTPKQILDLTSGNVYSFDNPNGILPIEYDKLQRRAYQAMANVAGDCLQQVLDALDVTTPNITVMTDLLDPVMIFPTSYLSLTLADTTGPVLIYDDNGAVNQFIAPKLNAGPTGCEQLAKIIPPDQAAANRAIGTSLSQIKNIDQVTLPEFAAALIGA